MTALWDRIRALRAQTALSPCEHDELAALTRELARATGLGGRARSFVDAPERARIAVRKAIKRAIDEISLANATVGQHLARHIETGTACCYHLEIGAPTQPEHADSVRGVQAVHQPEDVRGLVGHQRGTRAASS
jgi:hypothetical protein